MAWQTLLDVIAEARELERINATKIPVECPNDFTALDEGPNGTLHCPYDGWTYPRDS